MKHGNVLFDMVKIRFEFEFEFITHSLAIEFEPPLGKCKPINPAVRDGNSRDWKPCTASTRSSSPARMERGNVILYQVCSLKKSENSSLLCHF